MTYSHNLIVQMERIIFKTIYIERLEWANLYLGFCKEATEDIPLI